MTKDQLLAYFLITIMIGCHEPQQVTRSTLQEDARRELDNYVQSTPEVSGAWLYIGQTKKDAVELAIGHTSQRHTLTLDMTDGFRIASISKLFTATTVMKLQEAGMLNINHAVENYLPQGTLSSLHEDDVIAEITIIQLLQHTSGIEDYVSLNWISTLVSDPFRSWTPQDLLDHVKQHGNARFAPGSSFYYSDTNYVLLGLVIEQVTNLSLEEAYKKLLFDPLSMTDTYLESSDIHVYKLTSSAYYEDTDVTNWDTSSDWGGGGLVSTLADMATFMTKLIQDRVFEGSSFETMKHWLPTGPSTAYGLGIGRFNINGAEVIGHAGQGFGFSSSLYYYPEKQTVICMAVNQQFTDFEGYEAAVIRLINKHY